MKLKFVDLFYTWLVVALASSVLTGQIPTQSTGPNPIDPTTLELYDSYVARIGKIESRTVEAAIELVAARSSTISLRENCNAVLFEIYGQQQMDEASKPNWDTWWRNSATSFAPRPVPLKQ